jgi:hypothetical protein
MHVQRQRRWLASAAAVLLATTLAACGGGGGKEKKAVKATTTTAAAATTTAPLGNGGAPLTGLPPTDAAKLARAALIVKIDNAPKGRPQAGLNQADVIVEEGVEGGITRFATIFHSQDAVNDSVGPVRSARTTDIFIASPMNRPLFAWSGSNADFVKLIRQAPLVDVGVGVKAGAYHRERGRPNPYDLFASFSGLYAGSNGGGPPAPMFAYRANGEVSVGETANKAHVQWKDKVRTDVDWAWDAASGTWKRTQNGTAHVDATGAQLSPKNVVVQFVTYHDTGYRDRSNTIVPEADLVGQGDAWVLTDGKVVRGRWSKPAPDQPTAYTDAAGTPIKLTPGQTWIELPKPGDATVSA